FQELRPRKTGAKRQSVQKLKKRLQLRNWYARIVLPWDSLYEVLKGGDVLKYCPGTQRSAEEIPRVAADKNSFSASETFSSVLSTSLLQKDTIVSRASRSIGRIPDCMSSSTSRGLREEDSRVIAS